MDNQVQPKTSGIKKLFRIITLYEVAKRWPMWFFVVLFLATMYWLLWWGGWNLIYFTFLGILPTLLILNLSIFVEFIILNNVKKILHNNKYYKTIISYLYVYSLSCLLAFLLFPSVVETTSYTILFRIGKLLNLNIPKLPNEVAIFFYASLFFAAIQLISFVLLQVYIFKAKKEAKTK